VRKPAWGSLLGRQILRKPLRSPSSHSVKGLGLTGRRMAMNRLQKDEARHIADHFRPAAGAAEAAAVLGESEQLREPVSEQR